MGIPVPLGLGGCQTITHFNEGRRKREEGRRKKEEGRGKKEEGRRKREEGRRKREEGMNHKGTKGTEQEGRRKKEKGRGKNNYNFDFSLLPITLLPITHYPLPIPYSLFPNLLKWERVPQDVNEPIYQDVL
jgi:hypothetical protein